MIELVAFGGKQAVKNSLSQPSRTRATTRNFFDDFPLLFSVY
jgi:hypothetical protein